MVNPVSLSVWEYRFVLPDRLDAHRTCEGKLSNRVHVDQRWQADAAGVLRAAAQQVQADVVRA